MEMGYWGVRSGYGEVWHDVGMKDWEEKDKG